MRRVRGRSATGGRPSGDLQLIRRSGQVVAWNERKIEIAVRKAFLSLQRRPRAGHAARAARDRPSALARPQPSVPIEKVQDIVQEELVLSGQMRVAERYILYRAERAMLRAQGRIAAAGRLRPPAP